MEKISKRRRLFIILSTYIILITTPKIYADSIPDNITYNSEYVVDTNDYYATINNRKVYFIRTEDKFTFTPPDDNIYIIDERDNTDPNISVVDSYKFTDKEIRELLSIILRYEEMYPTDWNRTFKSAFREWAFHNRSHNLSLEIERTGQVDLNNEDEEKYSSYLSIIEEIINNIKPKTKTLAKDDN